MKILHVLAQLPSKTGSGVYYTSMIEGFKKYNHEQKAVFASQDEYVWDFLERKDQYPLVFKTTELPFPIAGMSDVMPYESITYSSLTKEMVNVWKEAFRKILLRIKNEFTPDIIFAHHLWMLTSLVIEVFPDTKIIGICHNTDLRQARMNPEFKNKYVKNIEKLNLVFSISDKQKDEIEEIYNLDKAKIITVGGGFNQDVFYFPKEKIHPEIIRLVFCGKIDPSKGIYELIDVYKSLEFQDVTLDIIGNPDNDNKERIKNCIKDDFSIRLMPAMKQIELADYLREKHIFIMPSFYEGVALMAIESLACGMYVVATDIEALRTLLGKEVEESGIIKYVPLPGIYDTDKPLKEDLPLFKENLRKAILYQIEKVRDKKECHIGMEEKLKSFSWEKLVNNMNDIISSMQ